MEMTRGKIIGLSVVGAIILIVIIYFIYKPKTTTGTPPINTPAGTTTTATPELPSCDTVNKQCRSKCINKWWIPVAGITEYQKCMDKCKVANPCI